MVVPKRSDIKDLGILPKFAHFEFPRASLKCLQRLSLLFAEHEHQLRGAHISILLKLIE
jgi:hypothetical protein